VTAEDRAMREVPTLTDAVVRLAGKYRWKVYRRRMGRASWDLGSGFPDLLCLRGSRLVVIELKRETEEPDPAQEQWLTAFRSVGGESYVFRPSDLRLGTIEAALQ
jgi:hypothetical protein